MHGCNSPDQIHNSASQHHTKTRMSQARAWQRMEWQSIQPRNQILWATAGIFLVPVWPNLEPGQAGTEFSQAPGKRATTRQQYRDHEKRYAMILPGCISFKSQGQLSAGTQNKLCVRNIEGYRYSSSDAVHTNKETISGSLRERAGWLGLHRIDTSAGGCEAVLRKVISKREPITDKP